MLRRFMRGAKKDRSKEIGKIYGSLKIWDCGYKYYTSNTGRKSGVATAYCVCDCGSFRVVLLNHLQAGKVISCGCESLESFVQAGLNKRKHLLSNHIGKKYGRLTVLGEGPKRRKREFACVCECGNLASSPITNLLNGTVLSCGCARENIGLSHQHTTDDFLRDILKITENNYDYSKVKYVSNHEKVEIVCTVDGHGSFFQTPANHKQGAGCPKCREKGFNDTLEGTLYVLEANGITKVGITNIKARRRASFVRGSSRIDFKVYNEYRFSSGEECRTIEGIVLKLMRENHLNPETPF
jgi:hypothetical protein